MLACVLHVLYVLLCVLLWVLLLVRARVEWVEGWVLLGCCCQVGAIVGWAAQI